MRTTETLILRRGNEWATVVSDGDKVAMYGSRGRKFYKSMLAAVAVAEAHGFAISTEEGWNQHCENKSN